MSKDNWADVIHIGDVTKVYFHNGILYTENGEYNVGKIDLVLAGSPCQGFSMAGKQLAFDDPRSKLYFEFERIFNEVTEYNPQVKFVLENVKMKKEYKDIISIRLGKNNVPIEPVAINSNLVSAQNRYRLYWTNISDDISQPKDRGIYLKDVLQDKVDDKYYVKAGRLKWLNTFGEVTENGGHIAFNPEKVKCPTVNCTYILQWPHGANNGGLRALDGKTPTLTTSSWESNNYLLIEGVVRKLTPEECEILQTLPTGYTKGLKDGHRYKALGNGWTVDVIAHILNYLK